MVYLKLVIQREYSALFFFLLSLGVIYKAHWAFCSLFCRSYEFLTYIDTYIWLKLACSLPTQGIQQVCYNTPLPGSTYISFGMEEHLSHSFSCNVAILVLHDWPNAITWHGHGEAAPLTSRIKSFLMSGGHEKMVWLIRSSATILCNCGRWRSLMLQQWTVPQCSHVQCRGPTTTETWGVEAMDADLVAWGSLQGPKIE